MIFPRFFINFCVCIQKSMILSLEWTQHIINKGIIYWFLQLLCTFIFSCRNRLCTITVVRSRGTFESTDIKLKNQGNTKLIGIPTMVTTLWKVNNIWGETCQMSNWRESEFWGKMTKSVNFDCRAQTQKPVSSLQQITEPTMIHK